MKRIILSGIAMSFAILALMAFTTPSFNNPQDKPASQFPADVEKIFQVSCNDCHTDAASNAKAKLKLNFSKWGELSDAKKIGKMESINEVIVKGDMPPGKYLENHPDAKLSDDQKAVVKNWVTEESKKLMGE
jgi:mono/diheme cytochrome c family protein